MEIKPNSACGIAPVGETSARRSPASSACDRGDFRRHDALQTALAQTPDIRAEEVDRARELVASADYPPLAAVRRLAALLVKEISSDTATSGADSTVPQPPAQS